MEWKCSTILGQCVSVIHHFSHCQSIIRSPLHYGRKLSSRSYGGKLRRIERQIHHYGSGLNALVLLSAFRTNPEDSYLLRVGYGGMNGPLSNINQEGFAAASFHSWPDTLKWDGISGDYGPGFLGLVLGAGTYVSQDSELGLLAYGGELTIKTGSTVTVTTRDAVRRKIYIGPLGLQISIDAGIIQEFTYDITTKIISVSLSQLSGVPRALSTIVWVDSAGSLKYGVITLGLSQVRLGWQVPLQEGRTIIQIGVL
jgi:hypothetical protein